MKKLTALFLLLFLWIVTMNAQTLTPEQQQVWKASTDIYTNWAHGDIQAFASQVHPNYSGWGTRDSVPLNKESMVARFTKIAETGKLTIQQRTPVKVTVKGNTAVVDYYFLYYLDTIDKDKKNRSQLKGKNAEFFIKENGKWLLLGDMTDIQVSIIP